jgi:hypothetical protein
LELLAERELLPEMHELASALDDAGLPSGFGSAAADLYAGTPRTGEETS